jgi:hypothetical protein
MARLARWSSHHVVDHYPVCAVLFCDGLGHSQFLEALTPGGSDSVLRQALSLRPHPENAQKN